MKTHKFLIAMIFLFSTLIGNAQDAEVSRTLSADNYRQLVIDADGEVEIESVESDQITVESKLYKKGKTWGWKNPPTRPDFEIKTHESGKKLILMVPEKFQPGVIGVTTYREEIITKLRVPGNMNVELTGGSNVKIYGNFISLKTKEVKNLTIHSLSKNKISRMQCYSEDKLVINSETKPKAYEMEGPGTNLYDLNARGLRVWFR